MTPIAISKATSTGKLDITANSLLALFDDIREQTGQGCGRNILDKPWYYKVINSRSQRAGIRLNDFGPTVESDTDKPWIKVGSIIEVSEKWDAAQARRNFVIIFIIGVVLSLLNAFLHFLGLY